MAPGPESALRSLQGRGIVPRLRCLTMTDAYDFRTPAITWRRLRPTRRERAVAAVLGVGLAAWGVGLFLLVLWSEPAASLVGMLSSSLR